MKTTVILLALSFVCASFLNAQNDQFKTKKTNTQEEVYMEDGFAGLLVNGPESNNPESVYLHQMKRTKLNQGNLLRLSVQTNPFSARGIRICCFHPDKIEQYNAIKGN